MKFNRRVLCGILASLSLTGFLNAHAQTPPAANAPAPAPAPTPIPGALQVISFGGGFNLPIWAARDQGFFKKHGIEVQHTITADSKQVFSPMMEAAALFSNERSIG